MIDEFKQDTNVAHVFYEENYDVDQIIGVQNIRIQDPVQLGALALERLGDEFSERLRPGSILVGARNFGYGHPHVQALFAMQQLGIAGLIADSFTPAFWRGAMSNGFPLVSCPGVAATTIPGDTLEIDWWNSSVYNYRTANKLPFKPYTEFENKIFRAGGIVPFLTKKAQTDSDEE